MNARPRGPQSVVDWVTETVRAMVLDGELAPGEDVAIQDLSQRLDVSHIPVREALRRLETCGLVIFRRGRRPQIAPVSVEDFDDIFRVRRLLEGAAAERSARHFTPVSLAALGELFADFRAAMGRSDAPTRVPELHRELHLALLPGASPWERRMLLQIWDASERYGQIYIRHEIDHQNIDAIVEDHDVLIEAAGSTTPREFRRTIVSHIDGSIAALRPLILEVIAGRAERVAR